MFPGNVYIINRKSETERLTHCQKQLAPFFRSDQTYVIEASEKEDALASRYDFFSYLAFQNMDRLTNELVLPTWSAAACALSHFRIWNMLAQMGGDDLSLVVEDDILITHKEKFRFRFHEMLHFFNRYPQYPMLCLLDGKVHPYSYSPIFTRLFPIVIPTGSNMVEVTQNTTRTHAYLLNKNACRCLVERMLPISYQIDIQLCTFARQNRDYYLFNCPDAGTDQCSFFPSQTQYHHLTISELTALFPENTALLIHSFLDVKIASSMYEYSYHYGYMY